MSGVLVYKGVLLSVFGCSGKEKLEPNQRYELIIDTLKFVRPVYITLLIKHSDGSEDKVLEDKIVFSPFKEVSPDLQAGSDTGTEVADISLYRLPGKVINESFDNDILVTRTSCVIADVTTD